jgi:TolB-like protein/Flp pilus assembly protein TadD/DNA-binding winged helix-turn-helix (wHTH) protein
MTAAVMPAPMRLLRSTVASRAGAQMSGSTAAMDPVGYEVEDLYVDLGRQRVSRDAHELPLSALSFDLLLALVRAAPNLLTYDQLMQQVWPGLVVSPETVSQRVKLVREAIGDDAHSPRYIVGVRGRGYRLLARAAPVLQRPTAVVARPDSANGIAGSVEITAAANADSAAPSLAPESTGTPTPLPVAPLGDGQAGADASAATAISSAAAGPAPRTRRPFRLPRDRLAYAAVAVIVLVGTAIGWRTYTAATAPGIAGRPAASQPARESPAMIRVERPRQTIAVLPLMDLSAPGAGAYVGDGLAEELGYRLAQVPGLRVAARSSAFAFGNKPSDVREVGRLLGVRHVLEGSVRRDGNRLRVTAQLVDTDTGYNVWSQSYDRAWKDVLAIQEDVASSIVQALQIVLAADGKRQLAPATRDPGAFDAYLAGLAQLRRPRSGQQLAAAERSFRDALAIDPQFARAHAALCETYVVGYERSRTPEAATRAERACADALRLEPGAVEVQRAQGRLQLALGRSADATRTFQAAIASRPEDSDAYIGLARAYLAQNLPAEAEASHRRAIDVDPTYWAAHNAFGAFLLQRGRPAEAVGAFRRVTTLAPTNASALNNLGAALQMTGDHAAAAAAFEQSLTIEPNGSGYSNAGSAYYYLGRHAEAVTMFRRAAALAPDDHSFWGNLADALAATPDGRKEARETYRRAATLAERALQTNPEDATSRAQLASYYAATGDLRRAQAAIERALREQPDLVWVQYYASRVALARDDRAAALAALGRALELGYPRAFVRSGPEFAALRDDPGFDVLAGTGPGG